MRNGIPEGKSRSLFMFPKNKKSPNIGMADNRSLMRRYDSHAHVRYNKIIWFCYMNPYRGQKQQGRCNFEMQNLKPLTHLMILIQG